MLQDWAQALGVERAFARTAEVLRMILGLNLPADSLERMNRKMSESVADFRASLPAPAAKDEGEILVATADNKGVPMRRAADQLPAGARRKKGEKANKKQMAAVSCVYTVDQKVRTAEDVVAALFREHSPRPQPERISCCQLLPSFVTALPWLRHTTSVLCFALTLSPTDGRSVVSEPAAVRRDRPGIPWAAAEWGLTQGLDGKPVWPAHNVLAWP